MINNFIQKRYVTIKRTIIKFVISDAWFLKQIFSGLCYQLLPTDYQFSLGPSGNDDSKIFCLDFFMTKSKVLPNTNRKFQVANMAQRRQKNRKPHIKVMLFFGVAFSPKFLKSGKIFWDERLNMIWSTHWVELDLGTKQRP